MWFHAQLAQKILEGKGGSGHLYLLLVVTLLFKNIIQPCVVFNIPNWDSKQDWNVETTSPSVDE